MITVMHENWIQLIHLQTVLIILLVIIIIIMSYHSTFCSPVDTHINIHYI